MRTPFNWQAPGADPGQPVNLITPQGPALKEIREQYGRAVRADIRKARAEERRRHAAEFRALLIGGAVLAFAAGVGIGLASCAGAADAGSSSVPAGVTSTPVTQGDLSGLPCIPMGYPPAEGLPGIPLPVDTQWEIFDLTDRDPVLFGALMGIADWETRGTFQATDGDGGKSKGIFQVNTVANYDKVEARGYTPADMRDPVKGAAVAVDILTELRDRYGFGDFTGEAIYMAYNMGPTGARNAMAEGTTSTEYSRETLSRATRYAAAALAWDIYA